MMQGSVSAPRLERVLRPLLYRVRRRDGGWCVVVKACATRPMPDRAQARALARALQAEADGLRHQSDGSPS